ncbi:putative eukaryotic translation initiation factor 3 subunit J [Helianthus anomalus]
MAPKKSKPVQEKEKAIEVVKEAPLDPVAEKLRQQRKAFIIGMLKHVMRLLMTSLKAADAKEVASSVTAVANKKLKAEKEAATG